MSASIHVNEIDTQDFLDDQEAFLEDHDHEPSRDITFLRDADFVNEHIKTVLYRDHIEHEEVLLLADAVLLIAACQDNKDTRDYFYELGNWLMYWGEQGYSIQGMH